MNTQRFFFLHVMKTAGWTLRRQIGANFEPAAVYPCKDLDPDVFRANFELARLTSLPESRRAQIRVFSGHFPLMATDLVGGQLTTITILRDPVERTLSLLRQRRAIHKAEEPLSLEEIYEDPFLFSALIHDHQAKLFALTQEDRPDSYMHELEIDASRLQAAKRNLEQVDVVGTQDRFEELWSELERRFGWRRAPLRDWNVRSGPPGHVPASFRKRIAEDNRRDMEFFEHARALCAERRATAV